MSKPKNGHLQRDAAEKRERFARLEAQLNAEFKQFRALHPELALEEAVDAFARLDDRQLELELGRGGVA